MKTAIKKLMLILAALALGSLWIPAASAECANSLKAHVAQQSWKGENAGANLLLVNDGPTIVGMWHVAFIAEGNAAPLPPDGTQVDDTLSHWHSDGTEVTLSSRPPATGDVCLGVWERVGERHYKLNHYGIAFDPSVDPNTPRGFDNIRQDIILSRDGMSFVGRFSVSQYDSKGTFIVEIRGKLIGTRVTIHTTDRDLVGQN